ncbi:DUF86 domain-containing protein [Chloroflexi bacterium CFX6]|nr:DUF86 domain-containing protein [Chloroflexi bacterium CFX6]
MKRDDTVYLRHILDAIELIEEYTRGMSENEFLSNSMAHDAVVRQVEIIGEAAGNISDEFQERHKELPWGKMIGIRNKIIHEYFNVNYAIVWDTVKDDLPILKKSVKKLLK